MRYLVCIEWNEVAQTCAAEAWVAGVPPWWAEMLPTTEQAHVVGVAMFTSLMLLAAMKRILKPGKESEV